MHPSPTRTTLHDWLTVLGLSILSLIVIRTALIPGCTWKTHDLMFNMERFAAASYAIGDGQFFPRWSRDLNFGYGYPLLLFYPPSTVMLVAGLNLAGIGILAGTKLLVAFSSILAAAFAYVLGRYVWRDRISAAFTAVCYILLPYHLLTIMVRGALAEYAAHALAPALLWAFLRLPAKPSNRAIALIAALSGLLMLTHNASYMLTVPLCLATTLINGPCRIRKLLAGCGALLLGLGISAFYWIPAFIEKSLVAISNLRHLTNLDYHNHFANLEKIFSEKWGYDGIGITLSVIWVIAVIITLKTFGAKPPGTRIPAKYSRTNTSGINTPGNNTPGNNTRGDRNSALHRLTGFFLICVPLVILLTTPVAAFIWDHIVLLQYVQFPWRLTAIAGLCAAAAAPAAINGFARPVPRCAAACVATAALLIASPLQTDRQIQRFDDRPGLSLRHLRTSGTTAVVGDEYLPLTVKTRPEVVSGPRQEMLTPEDPCAVWIPDEDRSHRISAFVVNDRSAVVQVNCLYFPGWIGTIDGKTAGIRPHEQTGLIEVDMPAGDHHLELAFVNTPIRTTGIVVSILSFLFLLAMVTAGTRLNPFRRSLS